MFGLFKKKKENKFEDNELRFFQNIVDILPSRYSYLRNSITKDFILGWKANELGYSDSYTFLLNANLEKRFKKKELPHFFILKNIGIWEASMQKYLNVELDILTGFLGGFKSESVNFKNFDFTKVDLSKLTEKHFKNEDKDNLMKIIGDVSKDQLSQFELEDTFKIEIPEGNFYTIKNLGDGNYLALNEKGEVYELIHEPYSVKKITDSIIHLSV